MELLPRLTAEHDAGDFTCGAPEIDEWLKTRALDGQEVGNATVFVVEQAGRVLGFYALASGGVERSTAPRTVKQNSPDPIPILLLARLGVSKVAQGRGVAKLLLRDALWRTVNVVSQVGFRALVVHCRDDVAKSFYQSAVPGAFKESPADPLCLFLPTSALVKLAAQSAADDDSSVSANS
jgi:GNAT superfamily N-acetyltransferase